MVTWNSGAGQASHGMERHATIAVMVDTILRETKRENAWQTVHGAALNPRVRRSIRVSFQNPLPCYKEVGGPVTY